MSRLQRNATVPLLTSLKHPAPNPNGQIGSGSLFGLVTKIAQIQGAVKSKLRFPILEVQVFEWHQDHRKP